MGKELFVAVATLVGFVVGAGILGLPYVFAQSGFLTGVLSVLFIVLLGLIKSDQLHYLQIVTPLNAAILIISSGLIMFMFKLAKFLLEKNQD